MLSSLYVAAAMPAGVETELVDEEIRPVDYDTDADLVGITFMTFNAPRAYRVADRFRSESHKPVILGGYHPTFLPEEAIQHADAVCIGDAEDTVPLIIQDFAAGALKPFYHSEFPSLAGLPRPDRSLIRAQYYVPAGVMQATAAALTTAHSARSPRSTSTIIAPGRWMRSSRSSKRLDRTCSSWTIT